MGRCFAMLEKYEHAIISYKYMLQLAWTSKSMEAEMAAYEALGKMHLYLGNIEKVKFYDSKINFGQMEHENSQLYKVHVTNTVSEHPWLRKNSSNSNKAKDILVGKELLLQQAENVSKFNSHLKCLFSEKLRDFSLMKPDIIMSLIEVTNHFKQSLEKGHISEMADPSIQYLHSCDIIGTPRRGQGLGITVTEDMTEYRVL